MMIAICPECGDTVPETSGTHGLCPRCLMQTALKETPHRRSTLLSGFAAPRPDQLAGMFSELEILRLVGQGGMGAVYEARQRSLQRSVAVKLFPYETADDPTFVERFHLEAQTLAGLSHPGIVTVHDFGRTGEFCYFVMEYVNGGNLRDLQALGPLSPRTALHIADQVADALAYAHGRGVVHRDVKPENVLLEVLDDPETAGNVKLADFGLAKLLALDPTGFMLTDPEHRMGTPHYMAPEQIEQPEKVDHRADVYSLGVVLYEMLTGELPLGRFGGVSEKAGTDPRLDELVLRCLEKDPDRRHQQVSDMREDLATIAPLVDRPLRGSPEAASQPKRHASPTLLWTGLLLVVTVVCLLAWQITIRIRGRGDGTAEVEIEASGDVEAHTRQRRRLDPHGADASRAADEADETSTNERLDSGRPSTAGMEGSASEPVTRAAEGKDQGPSGGVRLPWPGPDPRWLILPTAAELEERLVQEYGAERVVRLAINNLPGDVSAFIQQRIQEIASSASMVSRGTGRETMFIVCAPVADIQELASRVDFGTVTNVDLAQREITVRADPSKLPEPLPREITNPRDPEFYKQNFADLTCFDKDRVNRAMERLAKAKPAELRHEIAEALEPYLLDPEPATRQRAVSALSVWADEDIVPLLIDSLSDDNSGVRQRALELLGGLQDERSIAPVAELLLSDRDRGAAARCLRAMGSMVEDEVLKMLSHSDRDVVKECCNILSEVGTEQSTKDLQRLTEGSNFFIRGAATKAIREIQSRELPP